MSAAQFSISPVVGAGKGEDGERDLQFAQLKLFQEELRQTGDQLDNSLADILHKVRELALKRERQIAIILSDTGTLQQKTAAFDSLSSLRDEATQLIDSVIYNRICKRIQDADSRERAISTYRLINITSTIGYYHNVEESRNYDLQSFSPEEAVRALEPSTLVKLDTTAAAPDLTTHVSLAIADAGKWLNQFAILLAIDTENSVTEMGEVVMHDELPVINTARITIDLSQDMLSEELQSLVSQSINLEELLSREVVYTNIARVLANYGFAGATFLGTKLSLMYIPPLEVKFDGNIRAYDKADRRSWLSDLKLALDDIQQMIERELTTRMGLSSIPNMVATFQIEIIELIVIQKGDPDPGTINYDQFSKNADSLEEFWTSKN